MIEVTDEMMEHARFIEEYTSRYQVSHGRGPTPAHWLIWYKGRRYEAPTEPELREKVASDPRNDPSSPLRSNYAITEMRAISSTAWDRLQSLRRYQFRGLPEEPELDDMVAVMEQVVALTDRWKNPRKKRSQ